MASSYPLHRPSSWPIRRERQQFAAAKCMQEIIARLDSIDERLSRFQEQPIHLPLGLSNGNVFDMQERIQRLETLYVCKPNAEVDDVLQQMLQRKSMQTQNESVCSTYGNVELDCDTIDSSNAAFSISGTCVTLLHKRNAKLDSGDC